MHISTPERSAPVVRVFTMPGHAGGGNPAPVWLDAQSLSDAQMQELARASGHESVFVCAPGDDAHRWHMRYFVPNHEMEMCGHATIGALWLLRERGAWAGEPVALRTLSGTVHGRLGAAGIEISQPRATIQTLDAAQTAAIAQCLDIAPQQILGPVLNAATSRIKTLIRLRSTEELHGLQARAQQVQGLCESIGSTGLYPFALHEGAAAHCSARQFPKSSGYVEDPATGIAAAALAWGLRRLQLAGEGAVQVVVHQGEAMGSPSRIVVQLPDARDADAGCWLGGEALLEPAHGGHPQ